MKKAKKTLKIDIIRPIGFWKLHFNTGFAAEPTQNELMTGATSGQTARYYSLAPHLDGGSWLGGDAAGWMFVHTLSRPFTVGETITWAAGSCVLEIPLAPCRFAPIVTDFGDLRKDTLRTNRLIKKAKYKKHAIR